MGVHSTDNQIHTNDHRQISMIAIGGAIGTGLVIGSGSSLARSGPGSLFISYLVMGIVSIDRSHAWA
jgi:amino acid permease